MPIQIRKNGVKVFTINLRGLFSLMIRARKSWDEHATAILTLLLINAENLLGGALMKEDI